MKNLKKILMAFVLVALLISSVVTVAIAETSYTGSVDAANALIAKVYSAEGTKAKAEKLADVYKYLSDTPIDPEENGYDEVIARYNDLTFKAAYIYFGDAKTAEGTERAEALAKVYSHLAATPVILSGNSKVKTDVKDVEAVVSYICNACVKLHVFTEAELLSEPTDIVCDECDDKNSYLIPNKIVYSEFVKEVNDESLAVAELLLGRLFTASEEGAANGYYALIAIDDAIDSFLEKLPDESKNPDRKNELYTGSVVTAAEKLSAVNADSGYEELKAALADVYKYLVATPVNPTTTAYYEFLTKYNELCNALMDKFTAAFEAESSYPVRIEMLASLREYLMGKPADSQDPASVAVAGTQLSEDVITRFNDLRQAFIDELTEFKETVAGFAEIDAEIVTFEYETDVTEFNKTISDIAKIAEKNINDANIPILLAKVYNEFVSVKSFDPNAEGYAESIKTYSELCIAYVQNRFVSRMNSLGHLAEKHTLIIEFNEFVNETPLCEEVVVMYNEVREQFYNECKEISAAMASAGVPVYTAPDKAESTVTEAILGAFLSNLESSYNKYMTAAAEDKAAAFEAMKTAAAEMRAYAVGSIFDTEAEYFDEFVSEYDVLRTNVIDALFATVDEAQTAEAKLAALKTLKDYLAASPLTRAAVERYNAKALELEAGADMQLYSVYFDIDATIASINDVNATLAQKLAAGKVLKSYQNNVFDVTDPAYASYLAASDAAMIVIGDAIYNDITVTLTDKQILAMMKEYIAYAEEICSPAIISSLNKAADSICRIYDVVIGKIENNSNFAAYATGYENAYSIIEEFNSTPNLTLKFRAFAALYKEIDDNLSTAYFMCGPSYSEIKAEYDRMAMLLEDEMVVLIESANTPKKLESALASVNQNITQFNFSQKVMDKYNSAVRVDYAKYLEGVCESAEYKTPDGWNKNFTRITIALNRETGEGFYIAYNILAGVYGLPLDGVLEAPKVTDFGLSSFASIVAKLNSSRTDDIFEKYSRQEAVTFAVYEQAALELMAHLEACGINAELLEAQDKDKYENLQKLVAIAKYSVIDGYFNKYDRLSGDFEAQKAAAQKLDAYVKEYGALSYSEDAFAQTVLEYTFINFLDKLDLEMAMLEPEMKAEKIANLGITLVGAKFPANLISIYNVRYSTQLTAGEITKGTDKGSLMTLIEKLVVLEEQEGFNDVLVALADLSAYVSGSVFDTADLGASISARLAKVNKEIEEGSKQPEKIELTEEETKFIDYVETLLDESASAVARINAYDSAIALKNSVGTVCTEYKAALEAFDTTEIKALAAVEHLEQLKSFASRISLDEMASTNAAAEKEKADAISNYIVANGSYIDQTTDEFISIKELVSAVEAKVEWFDNLAEYVEAIKKFNRATSVASLSKHLEAISKYYVLLNFDDADNYKVANKDVLVTDLINKVLSKDSKVVALLQDVTLEAYYNIYIPARVSEQLCYENSVKIIDCIALVEKLITNKDELTAEAYYEALLNKANTEFDLVEPYITVVRKIVASGNYDEKMDGVKEALVIFELLDEPVYSTLQAQHIEIIKAQFEKYAATASYIEKAGICTYVENYIITNNVDTESIVGAQYLHLLEVYKAELESYKVDYEAILESNTQSFIGIVEKMGTYVTYSELKPLYDEAITKYYYSMNINSDEVKAAVEKFAEYEMMIENWEYNGAMLISYVENLNSARRRSQTFRALTNCKAYIDLVDAGVAGVGDAIADYNEALANYQAGINPVNSEITQSTDIVCSLRSVSIASTVLAVVKTIFIK